MLHTDGIWFKDEQGRTLLLRGVNLGGSSKVPARPDGATYRPQGFFDHRNVSFVGRPFPLQEAEEHFARLRAWGFTFLRFLVTWEAVEHAGPGLYDQEYLDYLYAVVKVAGEFGLDLFIDPHQDAWSRFSGGDGAPGWTFEAAGLDLTHFANTGAAITHQAHGDPLPKMIWPTNLYKLACASMFTLFFAGNDFAPQAKVDGEPLQDYLQRHYFAAMQQVALRLKDLPNVVGYETMNEPSGGYAGCQDVSEPSGRLKLGDCPSPYQSMLLGSGIPQEVEMWGLRRLSLKKTGSRWLNLTHESAWLPSRTCIWKQHGVWDLDRSGKPRLLQPDYFARKDGREVDFNQDYLRPFANRYAEAIRGVNPQALIFVEYDAAHRPPRWSADDVQGIVSAPHWYDALTLLMKRYSSLVAVDELTGKLVFGRGSIRKSFAAQLLSLKAAGTDNFGGVPLKNSRGVPTLIGEFGIPFDLNGKRAYRSGDFSAQVKALERSFRAVEDNLLSCTLWNYTSDNSNARGDQWNDEDFSIFSRVPALGGRDQQSDPADLNSAGLAPVLGGRGLQAVVRPYARRIAGEPLQMSFDPWRRVFQLTFRHDPNVSAPTVIFVPTVQYPGSFRVEVSDGGYEHHPEKQELIYTHSPTCPEHSVTVYE